MNKITLSLKIIGGLLAVVIIGGGIFLMTFDINQYRDQIQTSLSNATGRTVTFAGPIQLSIFPNIAITLQDVKISNATWAKESDMASIKELAVNIGLIPLLSKNIEINGLDITGANINLEQRGKEANWQFNPQTKPEHTAPSNQTSQPMAPIALSNASMTNSMIIMRNGNAVTRMAIDTMQAKLPTNGNLSVNGTLTLNDQKMKIALDAGTLSDLLQAKPQFPFNSVIEMADNNYVIKGKMDGGLRPQTVTADFSMDGKTIPTLNGTTTLKFGSTPTQFTGAVDIASLVLKSGEAKATSGDNAGNNKIAASNDTKRVIAATPLPQNLAPALNANLALTVKEIKQNAKTLGALKGTLTLNNGALALSPFTFTNAGGALNGDVVLNSMPNPPSLSVRLNANAFNYGALLRDMGISHNVEGASNIAIQLNGSGRDTRAFAANANGLINIVTQNGKLNSRFFDIMGGDIMNIIMPGNKAADANTLNCAVMRLAGQNGLFDTKQFVFDTPPVAFIGNGRINLGTEQIAIQMQPQSRSKTLGKTLPPIQLAGTFAAPTAHMNTQGMIQNAAGAVLSGALSGKSKGQDFLDILSGKNNKDSSTGESKPVANLCEAAIAGQPLMQKTAAAPVPTDTTPQNNQQPAPAAKPIEKMQTKDLLQGLGGMLGQ